MKRARSSIGLSVVLLATSRLGAQPAPPDTVRAVAALHQTLVELGPTIGPRIWPGFRPDTIATVYVIPHRAKLFAQWRDTLPTGFFALSSARGGWTDARAVSFPRGRPIAFLSVDSMSSAGSVLGLALHEQFHAFEQAVARRGRRFGAGENSMLVATYPAFDAANEATFALEGTTLARALRARTREEAKNITREFLALREERHARLDSSFVEFETLAELHEGLAQYAMLRGLRELARIDPRRFTVAADAEAAVETALLDSLLVVGPRSIRRRFYATGSAMARLLDWIADPSWKTRLVRDDATLRHMLAEATGYRGAETVDRRSAERLRARLASVRTDAERAVAALDARRRAQRDSVLGEPGVTLVINPVPSPGKRLDWCAFDPQNVLMMASGELLHTRMLQVCAAGVRVQFDQAVVEDRTTGKLRSVIGAGPPALRMTAGGVAFSPATNGAAVDVTDLRIEGPRVTVTARRAAVARRGAELQVTPYTAAP
jgi:hypothetical protein